VTISAVGDLNLGNTPDLPADPASYLESVRSALAGQIVFGNLEGTLTGSSVTSKCAPSSRACFVNRNPPGYASILRAGGFSVLNSANNHSHDYGQQGVADTSAALSAAGIVQTGRPSQIGVVTVPGQAKATRVAFVGFGPYQDMNSLLDLVAARALIQRANAEADLVVVYLHAGAEGAAATHVTGREEFYLGEDRGNPSRFAHAAIDAGADVVIASGPHVLRGMELYRGHLLAYSLGNFASYRFFSIEAPLDLSGVLTMTLNQDGTLAAGQFTSVLLTGLGQPTIDPRHAAATFISGLSAHDFGSAAITIALSGQLVLPHPNP
jgi:poly-gamma-glutamate capsule biosynthesis protein CapA/YwtB (metallophosphatase superfamily)